MLLCSLAIAHAAGPRPLRVEDLDGLREVGAPDVSPDGREVVYAVGSVDLERDEVQGDLFLVPTDGGPRVQLTATPHDGEADPRFSPDGRRIAFLSARGDEREVDQLWILERAGGEARRVTDFPGGVEDYAWGPDGRLVLVVADPDLDALRLLEDPDAPPSPIVIDRYYFLEDGAGWLRNLRRHLWSLDLGTGEVVQLTHGDHDELAPAVSPDGTRVAFVSKRGDDPDRGIDWDVWVAPLAPDAVPVRVTPAGTADNDPDIGSRPAWSPDGRTLAVVIGGDPARIYYATYRVALVPADGSSPPRPVLDVDRNTREPRFSADGKELWYLLEDDGSELVGHVPVKGGRPGLATPAPAAVDAFAIGGNTVVALASDPLHPAELHLVGKRPAPLTRENADWLADLSLGQTKPIVFPSADGTEVHGFLLTPPGYTGGRVPTVLRVHGGPVLQFRHEFEVEWQALAAAGFAVVGANPRGSSGRGEDWAMSIWAAWGDKDGQDVLAAVDHAVAIGVADPDRLGIGGWSYGGILTDQVIARDPRFDAAISGAGIANVLAGYGTDMYVREYEAELGLPWRDTDVWLRNSYPFLHADRIRTPTLFLCGEEDLNVPLIHSMQLYQALRQLSVPTALVVYPGEAHGIERPSFRRDRLQRYLEWYGRWLVGDATTGTP